MCEDVIISSGAHYVLFMCPDKNRVLAVAAMRTYVDEAEGDEPSSGTRYAGELEWHGERRDDGELLAYPVGRSESKSKQVETFGDPVGV